MNKQGGFTITINMILASVFSSFTIAGAYFATNYAQDAKASVVKEELVKQAATIKEELVERVSEETLARTNADTELNGKFEVVNTKIDNQTELIKDLMDGLGVKYSLPKQEEITRRVPIK